MDSLALVFLCAVRPLRDPSMKQLCTLWLNLRLLLGMSFNPATGPFAQTRATPEK